MPSSTEILEAIANQGLEKETPETPQAEPASEEPTEVTNNVDTPTEPAASATPTEVTEGPIELEIPDEPESFDFSSYIKDVGIDAKDPEEFKTKVKELINKEDPLKALPDKVRKAVEFAMKGGDIYQLLKVSQVDYSQVDPISLYENRVMSMVKDKEKAQEYLESMSTTVKEIEGEKLRQEYMQMQEQQEQALHAALDIKAKEEMSRKAENEKRLRESLNKVEDIAGFKVKPNQKDKFFKEVTSGKLSQRLFFDGDGNYDYDKMFRITFLADNFDKIQQYYKDRVKTATKRETIEELSNAQIDNPTGVPQLDTTEPDPLLNWAKSLRNGKKG